jgi:hypothetical protein
VRSGQGRDDKMPGLVVLTSTTSSTLPGFSGPGTNLAGLFNLTGVTNRDSQETELWDTWLVGAPVAGSNVDTVLTVAVVDDLNHDGIYNDAPNVVTDANGDGGSTGATSRPSVWRRTSCGSPSTSAETRHSPTRTCGGALCLAGARPPRSWSLARSAAGGLDLHHSGGRPGR